MLFISCITVTERLDNEDEFVIFLSYPVKGQLQSAGTCSFRAATPFWQYVRDNLGAEGEMRLCRSSGAGDENACDAFGFSLMIGSRFSWRFRIKEAGTVKQKRHVVMLGCGSRTHGAIFSRQNLILHSRV